MYTLLYSVNLSIRVDQLRVVVKAYFPFALPLLHFGDWGPVKLLLTALLRCVSLTFRFGGKQSIVLLLLSLLFRPPGIFNAVLPIHKPGKDSNNKDAYVESCVS